VFGCSRSVIVLGAVSGIVHVESCEHIEVITATRSIIVNNCSTSKLYLHTNSQPIIFDNNSDIQIAPYNTAYKDLAQHMNEAGVYDRLNLYNLPLQLGSVKSFFLLPPERFSYHNISFERKCVSACPLPESYASCLDKRMKGMALLMNKVRKLAKEDPEASKELKKSMNECFRKWLENNSEGSTYRTADLIRHADSL
jgi:hypothetical protein